MRVPFIAIIAVSLTATTSTLAIISNDGRELSTNLFNHSNYTASSQQEFPSSAPSSDDTPSDAPWSASNGTVVAAFVGEGASSIDVPLVALVTFSQSTPTPTTSQPTTPPKSVGSDLFTTVALNSNTTDVSGLAATCAEPPTNTPCDATRTCESIGYPNLCCSQWGVSTFQPSFTID
jgi:hypothetical protein